jgi:3-oxoacyl-[acyl-carrier-protein] synthase II
MPDARQATWITGIGVVSCLGEGPEPHWQALMRGKPTADEATFAPHIVHPVAPISFDKQIPKKSDQRQMDQWQRLGSYAAGLALDSAGLKGITDVLGRMDMIVAAGGGERDPEVDRAIFNGMPTAERPGAYLNERLMNDIRPTLFLAQLSNLMAGNISIVHGVTGSSRTFMGEEAAGTDAVRIAQARISAGQSDIVLVGGALNGERRDLLMMYEFGGYNLRDRFAPVWDRQPQGGFALGSVGAFLVLEAEAHARSRGAKPLARLTAVLSDRSKRGPGRIAESLRRMWGTIEGRLRPGEAAFLSGATGAEPATGEERTFLAEHDDVPVRAIGTFIGHSVEPQFPMSIAMAALAVSHGTLYPPSDRSGVERPMHGPLRQMVVTGVGHWRGEGMALVEVPEETAR